MSCGEEAATRLERALVLTSDPLDRLDIQILRLVEAASEVTSGSSDKSRTPNSRGPWLSIQFHGRGYSAFTSCRPGNSSTSAVSITSSTSWSNSSMSAHWVVVRMQQSAGWSSPLPWRRGVTTRRSCSTSRATSQPHLCWLHLCSQRSRCTACTPNMVESSSRVSARPELFGATGALAWILAIGAHGLLMAGEVGEAKAAAADGSDLARAVGNPYTEVMARSAWATISALEGDTENGAAQLAQIATATTDCPPNARAFVHLARAALRGGRTAVRRCRRGTSRRSIVGEGVAASRCLPPPSAPSTRRVVSASGRRGQYAENRGRTPQRIVTGRQVAQMTAGRVSRPAGHS